MNCETGLITPEQLAEYLAVPLPTIYQWSHHGRGPVVLKVGRHLRYRPSDVEAWLEECARHKPKETA